MTSRRSRSCVAAPAPALAVGLALALALALAGRAAAQLDEDDARGDAVAEGADGVNLRVGGIDRIDALSPEDMALEFLPAFVASISMIIVSELGDKTFFIAAIMAMRHSRLAIFTAAVGALAVMTVLSAMMGYALPSLLPRRYTHLASTALFLYFGVRLLYDARQMDDSAPNEELDEVESELDKKELEDSSADMEGGAGGGAASAGKRKDETFFSPVFVQCFTMTFLAEWGDRSQIATIAMAAAKDPFGVTVGGIIGHAMCTALAVVGGKLLATRISERTVSTIGGVLFLVFAAHAVMSGQ